MLALLELALSLFKGIRLLLTFSKLGSFNLFSQIIDMLKHLGTVLSAIRSLMELGAPRRDNNNNNNDNDDDSNDENEPSVARSTSSDTTSSGRLRRRSNHKSITAITEKGKRVRTTIIGTLRRFMYYACIIYAIAQLVLAGHALYREKTRVTAIANDWERINMACNSGDGYITNPKRCEEAKAYLYAEDRVYPTSAGLIAAWKQWRILIFCDFPMLSGEDTVILLILLVAATAYTFAISEIVLRCFRGTLLLLGYTEDSAEMAALELIDTTALVPDSMKGGPNLMADEASSSSPPPPTLLSLASLSSEELPSSSSSSSPAPHESEGAGAGIPPIDVDTQWSQFFTQRTQDTGASFGLL
jgi:hypothetical protein